MNRGKITSVVVSALVAVSAISALGGISTLQSFGNATTKASAAEAEPRTTVMKNLSTVDAVKEMGIGINLGNTFESTGDWINGKTVSDYEKAWGSPIITNEMIQGYKDAGFGMLRIPVAWSNLMSDDYTINQGYIDRVKEVASWAINDGMYAMINIHWDGGWWTKFSTDKATCMAKYEKIWTQLSSAFNEFGDYLVFESLNEEGCWNDIWNRYNGSTNGKAKAYGILNDINQKFVDVVRGSGGNNAKRHLLIAGYGTDIDLTCDNEFKMPTDSAKKCAVSVHYYTPSTFCILTEDADWGKVKTTWGTASDIKELNNNMKKIKTTFIDKGIPVIIGEYGCSIENKKIEQVRNFIETVCDTAYSVGACPVLWDTTHDNPQDGFYNRKTAKIYDSELATYFAKFKSSNPDVSSIPDETTVTTTTASQTDTTTASTTETTTTTDSKATTTTKSADSSEPSGTTAAVTTSVNSGNNADNNDSNDNKSNPATGAAFTLSGISLCAAALVLFKKRK